MLTIGGCISILCTVKENTPNDELRKITSQISALARERYGDQTNTRVTFSFKKNGKPNYKIPEPEYVTEVDADSTEVA